MGPGGAQPAADIEEEIKVEDSVINQKNLKKNMENLAFV